MLSPKLFVFVTLKEYRIYNYDCKLKKIKNTY